MTVRDLIKLLKTKDRDAIVDEAHIHLFDQRYTFDDDKYASEETISIQYGIKRSINNNITLDIGNN